MSNGYEQAPASGVTWKIGAHVVVAEAGVIGNWDSPRGIRTAHRKGLTGELSCMSQALQHLRLGGGGRPSATMASAAARERGPRSSGGIRPLWAHAPIFFFFPGGLVFWVVSGASLNNGVWAMIGARSGILKERGIGFE